LAALLSPHPLGELKRFPDPLAAKLGSEGEGRVRIEGRENDRMGGRGTGDRGRARNGGVRKGTGEKGGWKWEGKGREKGAFRLF